MKIKIKIIIFLLTIIIIITLIYIKCNIKYCYIHTPYQEKTLNNQIRKHILNKNILSSNIINLHEYINNIPLIEDNNISIKNINKLSIRISFKTPYIHIITPNNPINQYCDKKNNIFTTQKQFNTEYELISETNTIKSNILHSIINNIIINQHIYNSKFNHIYINQNNIISLKNNNNQTIIWGDISNNQQKYNLINNMVREHPNSTIYNISNINMAIFK